MKLTATIAAASLALATSAPDVLHNLGHGAVVLLHRCSGACPEVTAALEGAIEGATVDVRCTTLAGGPKARLVMSPDGELDTPIAAAAWGATYTATCVDPTSLSDFIASRYAKGPEDTCKAGVALDDPDAGAPQCDGGSP